ncbi:hypothetical protein [Carnobacterium maltaromaticum]|nr:hypothetical protein [Carnobacterium maltaromaticum]
MKSLLKAGYKVPEVNEMTLQDLELISEAFDEENEETVTLDKAFPFLFM